MTEGGKDRMKGGGEEEENRSEGRRASRSQVEYN